MLQHCLCTLQHRQIPHTSLDRTQHLSTISPQHSVQSTCTHREHGCSSVICTHPCRTDLPLADDPSQIQNDHVDSNFKRHTCQLLGVQGAKPAVRIHLGRQGRRSDHHNSTGLGSRHRWVSGAASVPLCLLFVGCPVALEVCGQGTPCLEGLCIELQEPKVLRDKGCRSRDTPAKDAKGTGTCGIW
mgnify:CR=1 FL=1